MDCLVGFLYESNMAVTDIRPAIPVYDLYGEAGDFPDLLHCESILARAALHDWIIRPHRHLRLHQFLLVNAGGGEAEIDGLKLPLAPAVFLNLPPGHVHAFRFEAGTEGWVVTAPTELLDAGAASGLRQALSGASAGSADTALAATFALIAGEYPSNLPGRSQVLSAAFALLASQAARSLSLAEGERGATAGGTLFARFETMVEQRYRDHLAVSAYASALGVSATHLSRIVRAAAGVSASRFIEARLMREARRELAYTNMNVQQIGYRLGYEDPAYFTRVFTRTAGIPPGRYRARVAGTQPASTLPEASE